MKASDRYIIAKMFLFIIQGLGVLVNILYNPSRSEEATDGWIEKTKEFSDEVDKWVQGG